MDGQKDGQTDKKKPDKQMDKRMELHQFRKESSCDGDLSLSCMNSIEQTVFELKSGNKNVDRQTDGQTDKKRTN